MTVECLLNDRREPKFAKNTCTKKFKNILIKCNFISSVTSKENL